MNSRALVIVIGVSVFVSTVAGGVLILGANGGGDSAKSAVSSTALVTAPSSVPVEVSTSAETRVLPTTTPSIVRRVAGCNDVYTYSDLLPLQPCTEGLAVERVQQALSDQGFVLDVDGYYGQGTTDAVQAFQLQNGLDPTGEVESLTWVAIVGVLPGVDLDGDGVVGPNEVIYD